MRSTALTYDDLAEAAGLMAERVLFAERQVLALNQKLAAAHGEMAALRGMLEFERERASELRQGGDLGHRAATATPPSVFTKLRRSFGH